MGRRKWEELSELATGATSPLRRIFPGEVTVEIVGTFFAVEANTEVTRVSVALLHSILAYP